MENLTHSCPLRKTKRCSRYKAGNKEMYRFKTWASLKHRSQLTEGIRNMYFCVCFFDAPLYQVLPLGQMLVVKGAAHMAMMEKPDDINQIIQSFLNNSWCPSQFILSNSVGPSKCKQTNWSGAPSNFDDTRIIISYSFLNNGYCSWHSVF